LLALNPFLVPGEEWKSIRSQLSPLFVAGRIRTAVPYISGVAKTMMEYIESGPESATMEFDVKDVN
jgi:cytochrome P450